MKKAINIEDSSNNIVRVLSIADNLEVANNSPNGLTYFIIEDYSEPPILANPSLDKAYPMYDTVKETFMWVVINYMYTAPSNTVELQNISSKLDMIHNATEEKNTDIAQTAIDHYTIELMEGGIL